MGMTLLQEGEGFLAGVRNLQRDFDRLYRAARKTEWVALLTIDMKVHHTCLVCEARKPTTPPEPGGRGGHTDACEIGKVLYGCTDDD